MAWLKDFENVKMQVDIRSLMNNFLWKVSLTCEGIFNDHL